MYLTHNAAISWNNHLKLSHFLHSINYDLCLWVIWSWCTGPIEVIVLERWVQGHILSSFYDLSTLGQGCQRNCVCVRVDLYAESHQDVMLYYFDWKCSCHFNLGVAVRSWCSHQVTINFEMPSQNDEVIPPWFVKMEPVFLRYWRKFTLQRRDLSLFHVLSKLDQWRLRPNLRYTVTADKHISIAWSEEPVSYSVLN